MTARAWSRSAFAGHRRVPPRLRLVAIIAGCALAGLATAGYAHEMWLSSSTYRAVAGDTVTVRAFVGTGFRGEPRPYAKSRAIRFTMRGADRIDLDPAVANGELRWAMFVQPDGGGQLLAYESNFASIELPADRFDAYLAEEGLDGPLASRRRSGSRRVPGRERYARCAKAWIAGSQAHRGGRIEGLTLEIVPLQDPAVVPRASFRILYRGKPLANALVRAWNRPRSAVPVPDLDAPREPLSPVESLRTTRKGLVTLDLSRPGDWLVNVVHMVPVRAPDADWQTYWSSFTFARSSDR